MSNLVIYTDSTCDQTQAWLDARNIISIPLTYIIDDKEYVDVIDEKAIKAFYQKMQEGKTAKTSAISTETFIKHWKAELKKENDVFYIGLAGKLSATYNNAQLAAKYLKEQYPKRKITVVDSMTTTCGLAYLLEHAVKMRKEGKTGEEIARYVRETREQVCAWFSVDDLQHLKRGGRLSGAAAMVGSILNIKPILQIDTTGALKVCEKVKGNKKVVKFFLNLIRETAIDPEKETIYIVHSGSSMVNEFEQAIRDEFHPKDIQISYLGSIVGAHVGPGMLAVIFHGYK